MFFITEIWHRIWRNKARSLLSIIIALFLVFVVGLYMGNIKKNEIALKNIGNAIPVTAQITNLNGSLDIGLEIDTKYLEAFLSADITNPVFTARAGGNLESINRVEPVKICDTAIMGANSLSAFPFMKENEIIFSENWGSAYLSGDKPVCIISESYAETHNITLGDELTFPIYVLKYHQDGITFDYIEVGEPTITVIGIFQQGMGADEIQQMIVPIRWLSKLVKKNGTSFYYDSARGTLRNPLKLNNFKAYMEENNFGEINLEANDRRSGDRLIVQDKIFIETATKLLHNIKMFRIFQHPFFILIVLLIILVSFLNLRSYQKEIAIASSLGRPGLISGFSFFLENLLLYLIGCIAILPILLYITEIGLLEMLYIYLLFIVCASIGIWSALGLLFRFNTLELLTRID